MEGYKETEEERR